MLKLHPRLKQLRKRVFELTSPCQRSDAWEEDLLNTKDNFDNLSVDDDRPVSIASFASTVIPSGEGEPTSSASSAITGPVTYSKAGHKPHGPVALWANDRTSEPASTYFNEEDLQFLLQRLPKMTKEMLRLSGRYDIQKLYMGDLRGSMMTSQGADAAMRIEQAKKVSRVALDLIQLRIQQVQQMAGNASSPEEFQQLSKLLPIRMVEIGSCFSDVSSIVWQYTVKGIHEKRLHVRYAMALATAALHRPHVNTTYIRNHSQPAGLANNPYLSHTPFPTSPRPTDLFEILSLESDPSRASRARHHLHTINRDINLRVSVADLTRLEGIPNDHFDITWSSLMLGGFGEPVNEDEGRAGEEACPSPRTTVTTILRPSPSSPDLTQPSKTTLTPSPRTAGSGKKNPSATNTNNDTSHKSNASPAPFLSVHNKSNSCNTNSGRKWSIGLLPTGKKLPSSASTTTTIPGASDTRDIPSGSQRHTHTTLNKPATVSPQSPSALQRRQSSRLGHGLPIARAILQQSQRVTKHGGLVMHTDFVYMYGPKNDVPWANPSSSTPTTPLSTSPPPSQVTSSSDAHTPARVAAEGGMIGDSSLSQLPFRLEAAIGGRHRGLVRADHPLRYHRLLKKSSFVRRLSEGIISREFDSWSWFDGGDYAAWEMNQGLESGEYSNVTIKRYCGAVACPGKAALALAYLYFNEWEKMNDEELEETLSHLKQAGCSFVMAIGTVNKRRQE